ncbi:MAG: hypothetical protein IT261_13535, partial [Saprospiraceae bacterium]|nr:hypothetical protein [Saprospiraceae bacterium]
MIFTLKFGVLNGQETYNPCAENSVATPSCTNGSRLCYTYSQFPCSPGYCWSGGGIPNNAGIPFNGIVSNKTIEIGGVYTVTQNVKFIDCIFKMRGDARIDLIPIGNVLMKMSFENCQFFGCDEMWQGIHINAAGANGGLQFVFSNNHVEDAYIGLLLDEINGVYSVFGNTFNNNHIGIANRRQNNLPLNAGFVQNTFAQTVDLANRSGSLAPPFPMPDYPLAHAGMNMIRTTASIGVANSANLFTCLFNGIISDQATILSLNNTFQNIGHHGVWATDGTLVAQGCRFFQTGNIGIWATGANLTATLNIFNGDWIEGIHSEQNLNAEQIAIDDNVFAIAFDNWVFGIFLERPQSSIGVNATINDNDFIINAEPVGMVCIQLKDFVNAAGNTEISLNTMNISNVLGGTTGIIAEVGQSDRILISDNTIDFTQTSTMFTCWGIAIFEYGTPGPSAPQLHRIVGNTITCVPANFANGNYAAQCGFHVSKLTDATFCENTVDETLWGFHFTNKCNIYLKENNIHHHDIGVFIVDQIGAQFGHGNKWDLDPNACATWAIQTLNTNPFTSEFIIPENAVLPEFPPSNKISPNPIMQPWFYYDPNQATQYCDQFAQPEVNDFTPKEQFILNNTSELSGAELWDAQLTLYTRLLFSPDLRPEGSLAETFYNTMQSDNIAVFASIQRQISEALVVSEGLQDDLDSIRSAKNLLFETVVPLD